METASVSQNPGNVPGSRNEPGSSSIEPADNSITSHSQSSIGPGKEPAAARYGQCFKGTDSPAPMARDSIDR